MMIRCYLAVLRITIREALVYRVDLLADLLSAAILLGIYYFLWRAVFQTSPTIQGLDISFMTGYIALVQIVQGFIQTEIIEYEIADEVRDGSIALELIRPYGFMFYCYLKAYSRALLGALLISLPIFLFALFALDLPLPPWWRLGVFLMSLNLGFAVNAALSFLVGLAAFPLRSNEGILQLKRFILTLLSGNLFPIVLLPGLLGEITGLLPFRATVDVPIGIYMGTLPPTMLFFQAGWALSLAFLGHLCFLVARRKLAILGG